ncbi:cytochrome D ubiquinol oxidase subunit I [Ligilactobacillus salitolerans]|uniref:Cytochrome D ubiquinol oxidase subunit I n=1 Tax=Ligilactobacillus salitolerans TaxID=1808352 RepID=A0A401IRR3_9LACO|nr:cytochrome ubiquinol oxidase subunit I [Ligilactobacillus salitolerans]GBG94207.1 cytochrome D ubiquinol oxidase subunit I [Ligilactobacillus salitolerans]
MNILDLARFQFGMTTIFHFFFVPFSIGTGLVVAIMETMWVRTKDRLYLRMTKFWGNIFLLSFAVGVVTGIIQEFQFGMNWSDYSRFMGDIFGAPLAIEALLAFFMESTFLGLWIFTWKMVKPWLHNLFMWLVTAASMLSAFWIITANAFMQHPTGYAIKNGRAVMTSFPKLIANTQAWYEFSHVIAGAIAMGGFLIAGMAAFKLLNKQLKEKDFFKRSLKLGLVVGLVGSIAVFAAGDRQMSALIKDQPMKFAATEGEFKNSPDPAPWKLIDVIDPVTHEEKFTIEIPYMLSLLSFHKPYGSIEGMDSVNKKLQAKYGDQNNYYPPINTLFLSFHLMALFGMAMLGVAVLGLFFARKKSQLLFRQKWMLWIVGLFTFVPFITNTTGWLVTELGRYPWTVYGLFTIKQSVSPNVSVGSLLTSNIIYFLLFTFLAIVMVSLVVKELKKGPDADEESTLSSEQEVDPFNKEAFE